MRIAYSAPFFRYLAVGGTLFLLDFGVFLVLVKTGGVDLRIAQAISRTAGAAVGFFGHRYLSFRATGSRAAYHWLGQGVGYAVIAAVLNIVVSPFVVWAVFVVVGGRLIVAKLTSDAIMVLSSYLLLRMVFRTHRSETSTAVSG